MQWSAVQGASAYDLYVGVSESSLWRLGSVYGTAVTVTGFRSGSVYFWKVVSRGASEELSSPVGAFQTR